MSNAVFPALPGLKWDVGKKPKFSTGIQKAASGKEARAVYWSYPRWLFTLTYEVLRQDTLRSERDTLMGFFLQRQGAFDSFLYEDPSDKSVTGQSIGTGNSVKTAFQLLRTLGGFIEPVFNINGTPNIYLNSVKQTSGYTIGSTGIVTFSTPPANGVAITADFNFYFRVRFVQDEAEFNQFMYNLWELKKVEMISIK